MQGPAGGQNQRNGMSSFTSQHNVDRSPPVGSQQYAHYQPLSQNQLNSSLQNSSYTAAQASSIAGSSLKNTQHNDVGFLNQKNNFLNRTQQLQQSTFTSQDVNLAIYPAPHPISPLGKHLSKLLPPSDHVIKFFNELFI